MQTENQLFSGEILPYDSHFFKKILNLNVLNSKSHCSSCNKLVKVTEKIKEVLEVVFNRGFKSCGTVYNVVSVSPMC